MDGRRVSHSRRPRSWKFLRRRIQYRDESMGQHTARIHNRTEIHMKRMSMMLLAGAAFALPTLPHAQVAGSTLLGIEATELREVTLGLSAKKQVLGKGVFNDNNERIGKVDD